MSELHTYRITWNDGSRRFDGPGPRGDVKAFSAADALTQFRIDYPDELVTSITPLPDFPPDSHAAHVAEHIEMLRRLGADAQRGSWREAYERACSLIGERQQAIIGNSANAWNVLTDSTKLVELAKKHRQAAAERDRLRSERDALACAVVKRIDAAEAAICAGDINRALGILRGQVVP